MKIVTILFCLLIASPLFAAEPQHPQDTRAKKKDTAKQQVGGHSRTSESGLFRLEMVVGGKDLKQGPNAFDLAVRDKNGKPVMAAEIALTPWMPQMGHGVWDKPTVTERPGGIYHVENVVVIMGGRWDLKVTIKKGNLVDRALFSYDVAEIKQTAPAASDAAKAGYVRTVKSYAVPNVSLLNQDGKKVKLRTLVDSGKPVIVNFIFTTCTTICPVLSAGFSNLRAELGANADKVQLISISIDPEHDRPAQLKEYAARFKAGKGWEFLTGTREDIGSVLKAFDSYVTDKMSHEPLYIFHAPNSDNWVRVKGLIGKADLMKEFRKIENK